MIVIDTNIIGTFAVIEELELLWEVFPHDQMAMVPAVQTELEAGIEEGRGFLSPVFELLESGKLLLLESSTEEELQRYQMPSSLDDGEAESIAICRARHAALLSNDRQAIQFCHQKGIQVYDLPALLRSIWKQGIRTADDVRTLIILMETKEGLAIRHVDRILKE